MSKRPRRNHTPAFKATPFKVFEQAPGAAF